MLLSESRFLLRVRFIASVFCLFVCFFALNCKTPHYKLPLSYKGQLSLFVLLVNRFLYLFSLHSPSQDDFRMTGAGNKLGANAKDGFLQCSILKSHDGAREIKTDIKPFGDKE